MKPVSGAQRIAQIPTEGSCETPHKIKGRSPSIYADFHQAGAPATLSLACGSKFRVLRNGSKVICHGNPGIPGLAPRWRSLLRGCGGGVNVRRLSLWECLPSPSLTLEHLKKHLLKEKLLVVPLSKHTHQQANCFCRWPGSSSPQPAPAHGRACGPHGQASSASRQLGQRGPKIRPLAVL